VLRDRRLVGEIGARELTTEHVMHVIAGTHE
jgi:hypothetical protein